MRIDEIKIMKEHFEITDEAFSKLSGVPADTINDILTGKLPPTDKELALLSEVFETGYPKGDGLLTLKDLHSVPDDIRCEFIDGKIYYMTVPGTDHQLISSAIFRAFDLYIFEMKKDWVPFSALIEVRLSNKGISSVQPDVFVVCDRDRINREYIDGAPDFIAEILSPSTKRTDRVIKRDLYMAAGVKEYWIVDPENRTVEVHLSGNILSKEYSFDERIPVHITGGELEISITDDYIYGGS